MPVPCDSQPGGGEGDAGGLPGCASAGRCGCSRSHHPSNPLWHLLNAALHPHTTQGLPSTLVLPQSPAPCLCTGAPQGIEHMK